MSLFCELKDLITESDVEQKFIYQFLVSKYPMGCSYDPINILTKHKITPFIIGKSKPKNYFPDYLINLNGYPVMIIEAKNPDINVYEVFSEARLYASEVNSKFPHNINPCKKIIVSNGNTTIAGFYDHENPIISISFVDITIGNIEYSKLISFASKDNLLSYCDSIIKTLKGDAKYYKPVGQIGGKKAQNSELKENSFGRTISLNYNNIFIPENESEYEIVVKNAYVDSKLREHHVEPILKTIRSIRLPSNDDSTPISSIDIKPFFNGLGNYVKQKDKKYSLILLIGSVGSGKTTFVRYLKSIAITKQPDLNNSVSWIILNMNSAPFSVDLIYNWLIESVIEKIQSEFPECDFGNNDFLSSIYNNEIHEFENGLGQFIGSGDEYLKQLFLLIKESMQNKNLTLKRLLQYINQSAKKECIVVLDNVDNRSPEFQLLMFQVAQWFRSQYSCLVMLPMRDTTYNLHRSLPPLDTVIKDLVFRIDPPDLLTVLQSRLKYIFWLEKNAHKSKSFILEHGMEVTIKPNQHMDYFKSVLNSIRQDNRIKNIFYSITGRNIRSGIELFIDFCKSGHLSAEDFFAIKATKGEYVIPHYNMMNAILRGNRVFYSDIDSKIKNLFSSDYNDNLVDPFVRIDILIWLNKMSNIMGPSGVKGFHKADNIIEKLMLLGHDEVVILRELSILTNNNLVITEGQLDDIEKSDLLRISQFGVLHLHLLSNITYLTACSEDVLYRNLEIAKSISDRITGCEGDGPLSKTTAIYNVEDMLNYLNEYKNKFMPISSKVIHSYDFEIYDLKECFNALETFKLQSRDLLCIDDKIKKYPAGSIKECIVTYIKEFGIFVSIDFEEEGFIPQKNLKKYNVEDFQITDIVIGKVISYRKEHKRFEIELIERK